MFSHFQWTYGFYILVFPASPALEKSPQSMHVSNPTTVDTLDAHEPRSRGAAKRKSCQWTPACRSRSCLENAALRQNGYPVRRQFGRKEKKSFFIIFSSLIITYIHSEISKQSFDFSYQRELITDRTLTLASLSRSQSETGGNRREFHRTTRGI